MRDTPIVGPIRAVLSVKGFRGLLAALAISESGNWLYNAALIAYVLDHSDSAGWIAAASIARLAPQILFGPIAGVMADRFDRKGVLLVADLSRAALMGALAVAAASGFPLVLVIALSALSTAAGTPYYPAMAALTPSMVGESHLAAANALTKGIQQVALAMGPAVGGILLAVGSPSLAFAVNGLSFLGSAALVVRLRMPEIAKGPHEIGLVEGLARGFAVIRSSRDLTILVGLFAAVTFTLGQGFVLLPVLAEGVLRTGPQGVGFLFTSIGIGGLLAAAPAARIARAPRSGAVITSCVLVAGLAVALLTRTHVPMVAYLLMGVLGAASIVLSVLAITMLQRLLVGAMIGRVFGLLHSLAVSSIVVGTLVAPLLIETTTLRIALYLAGFFLVAIALLSHPRLRSMDERAAHRAAELAPRLVLLQRIGIFGGASPQAFEALAANVEEVRVGAGEVVIREGEPADHFFVVVEGRLEVLSRATVINTMGWGDYFGEIGLLQRVPRTATVRAESDCTLYRIDGDRFLESLGHAPSEALTDTILGRLSMSASASR